MPDYRCTQYDAPFEKIIEKKRRLVLSIENDHPKVRNHYDLVSSNKGNYKMSFAEIFNYKCAYCGVSSELIPLDLFEVDHFVPISANKKNTGKGLNNMSNLILSCRSCNRSKDSFYFLDENNLEKCNPNNDALSGVFVRDDDYTIRIAEDNNEEVLSFFRLLNLGGQLKRLDFLLMSINGLRKKLEQEEKDDYLVVLGKVEFFLRSKRNNIVNESQLG